MADLSPDEVVGVGRPAPPRRSCRPPRSRRCAPSSARRDRTVAAGGARGRGAGRARPLKTRALGRLAAMRSAQEWVRQDTADTRHARRRQGLPRPGADARRSAENAPDAVVYPASAAEVRAVLDACARGGRRGGARSAAARASWAASSRCGTADGRRDLARPRRGSTHVAPGRHALADRRARRRPARARGRARARGARASRWATSRSRWSTRRVGGWVATRSAGQASTGYGSIDKLVAGLRCVAPSGEIDLRAAARDRGRPGAAPAAGRLGGRAGSDHARPRCRVRPRARRDAATRAGCSRSFEQGAEAFRALEQGHVIPDVARLSDEAETRLALTLSGGASLAQRAGRAYIGARGYADGCLAILGFEGDAPGRRRPPRPRAAHHAARRRAGAGRLAGPRLAARSATRARTCATRCSTTACMGETLETAAPWSGLLGPLRGGPRRRSAARSRRAARRGW